MNSLVIIFSICFFKTGYSEYMVIPRNRFHHRRIPTRLR